MRVEPAPYVFRNEDRRQRFADRRAILERRETTAASQEYVCPEGYSCPMPGHMSITYNHSGKCPICGMTLIPKDAEKGEAAEASSPVPAAPPHQP